MNLHGKIIAIDSGHGGHDGGAPGRLHPEKFYNRLVAQEVRYILLKAGAWPYTLRWAKETCGIDNGQAMRLRDRAKIINEFRAGNGARVDLVLSIHHNGHDDRMANGLEVWHYTGSEAGRALGQGVLDGMASKMPMRVRGLFSTKRFAMLKLPEAPSIITEGCFVTNASDENWLINNWRMEAAGIVAGLKVVELEL